MKNLLPDYPTSLNLTITALMTAVVCIVTFALQVAIPDTRGYFNIGESAVFATAILFGPLIGAFAGGVGSCLADIFSGYYLYAPATLVIKGSEGFLVGFLTWGFNPRIKSEKTWKIVTTIFGVTVTLILIVIGILYYTSIWQFTLAIFEFTFFTFEVGLFAIFWILLAFFVGFLIIFWGYKLEPEIGWLIISCLIGGIVMVIGYFLYEFAIFGIAALAEVPFNIGQFTIGMIIALPVAKSVKVAFPQMFKKEYFLH